MLRRQIRIYREFPIANELTYMLISGLFDCKHTNLRQALKKYTQPLENYSSAAQRSKKSGLSYRQLSRIGKNSVLSYRQISRSVTKKWLASYRYSLMLKTLRCHVLYYRYSLTAYSLICYFMDFQPY